MVDSKYILPNGNPYDLWEDKTQYKTLLHVSQKNGSLTGDGSESNPFLTIAQAVPLAKPGTKVIIHEGIYRETVRPICGGNSETEMVMFCGAEGENVESTPHSKMEFTVDCPVEIRPMSIMRKKAE